MRPPDDSFQIEEEFQYGYVNLLRGKRTETDTNGETGGPLCKDCHKVIPPRKEKRGLKPERCPKCRDEHSKNYMRNYSRIKRLEKRKTISESVKPNRTSGDWDLDNIPDFDEIFDMHFHDSGTGLDKKRRDTP